MTIFDRFIVIDWSAKNAPSALQPSKDSIWLAEASASGKRVVTRYFRTRHAVIDYVRSQLRKSVRKQERVLLGIDAIYAYPAGLAKALKLKRKPEWKSIWDLIHNLGTDDEKNRNNRFFVGAELNRRIKAPLGPFWGVPMGQSGIFLGAKKDFTYPVYTKRATLAEKRLVEQRSPGMQPTWKLAYTGSVGSQGLTAIPYLYSLRFEDEKLSNHSKVWPFETGFSTNPLPEPEDLIIHAEIWPSLVDRPRKDKIPDREQVRSLARWLVSRQQSGTLTELFDAPDGLSRKDLKRCIREEGWVLGVR